MADGIKLCAESESSEIGNEEEKVAQHPYNHQLTPYVETEQAPDMVEVEHQNVNTEDAFLPRLEDPISDYVYDRVRNPSSIIKRTRGRPRKDCQRPGKHHLGQSGATKVYASFLNIYFSIYPTQFLIVSTFMTLKCVLPEH